MTYVLLKPSSTVANTGTVTGAGSAHAALSDSSDSSYVALDPSELASFGLADLSLPSGGVVVFSQAYVRAAGVNALARTSILSGSKSQIAYTYVSWLPPSDFYGAFMSAPSDAEVDGTTLGIWNYYGTGILLVYELWLRVLYLAKPTVDVTAPTGTISTNRATVTWSVTWDEHAQHDSYLREVKIYSSAQYGAGGFDPDTSGSTAESGQIYGSADSHVFDNVTLDDGTYRAYVRVAASNSTGQWSDWNYEGFTVDVLNPGVPTFSATEETDCVRLDLDDTAGDTSTNEFWVQRSDGSGWVDVRTSLGDGRVATSGSAVVLRDYEAPNGVAVTYRARAYNSSVPSWSAWTTDTATWSSGSWWLKCSTKPSMNVEVTLRSYPGSQVTANQGVFRPLGASAPVVVSDVPGPETGQIVVLTSSLSEREDLYDMLAEAVPVLVQGPPSAGIPERWVVFGDTQSERLVDTAGCHLHDETLPFTVVDRPDGTLDE